MAFANLLTDFTQADGAPTGWTTPTGGDAFAFTVVSNQLAAQGNQTAGLYTGPGQYPADQEAGITVPVLPAAGSVVQVMILVDITGAAWSGYQARVTPSTSTWLIRRIDSGAVGATLATLSQAFAAGDFLGLRGIGGQIQTWYGSGGVGAAAQIDSRNDATYRRPGYVGLVSNNATTRFDDLRGGGAGIPVDERVVLQSITRSNVW